MATLKLGLEDVSALDLVACAQGICTSMQGAPQFPAPIPALSVVQAAIDALITANAGVMAERGRSDYQAKRVAVLELRRQLQRLATFVSLVADGDENIIASSGFGVRRKPARIGELKRPSQLTSRLTRASGRVDLDWEVIPGAKLYHVYISTASSPTDWQLHASTTKSRCHADGLVSGTFYWFAITAIGTAGETSKSDPLRAMASA